MRQTVDRKRAASTSAEGEPAAMNDSSDSTDQNANPDAPEHRADEIEQLRERLSFYESFDQLIHDNITRAGDLLREAAARKSEGDLAIRSANADFEQRQLAERVNYRRVFSGLLDEITIVQQNVERLARQVADALDDLEAVIPAAGEPAGLESDQFPSMPTFSAGSAGELAPGETVAEPEASAEAEPASASDFYDQPAETAEYAPEEGEEHAPEEGASDVELEPDMDMAAGTRSEPHEYPPVMEPVDEIYPEDGSESEVEQGSGTGALETIVGTTTCSEVVQESVERYSHSIADEMGSESLDGSDDGATSYDAEPIPDGGVSVEVEDDAPAEMAASDQEAADERDDGEDEETWADGGPAAATTVLVHGVPRATTALSLKRYLEGLAAVHSVEPREYAEGILRLQVSSDRPVGLDDLRGWPEGAALEPVSVSDDFVEVRLNQ
jgi:hypothetical protein